MKPLTITFILLANYFMAAAQTGQNAISKNLNPAFLNHIYFCQPDSLVELEQVDAHMMSRTKGLGYGGSEGGISME
ncbi:MAG TPA: hypothetical protein VFV08_07355, partial [Puia sp.]|nr:hypothetical protein [Puia sp.]